MNEMKQNRRFYLCAFLLPLVIAGLVCLKNEVYPFGENCILHVDMYHQYEPFFTELMDKLKNHGSLMYSFRIGLGSDFVSLFAYYLASPLNWLLVFCPASHVIEFMTVLILLKIALCGLTFSIYLKNHFKTVDSSGVVFAGFYALSGYMAAYYWNIMWLDCLVLAPLVILGLERLVKEGKCRLYCISLAISILANFYISIMLCIYLVLYYVILFFEETQGRREKIYSFGRFVLYSLLAGGMGAVLILPEMVILSYSGSSGVSFPDTVEWYFDMVSMLSRHCIDVEVYTGREHWPNLYCGAAIFLFLILYMCNKKIPWKKKVRRGIFIVFFWLSFANNMLDFIWHGLHFPDSLPGRQVYLYVFLLLTMAYEAYVYRDGNRPLHVAAGFVLSMAFLVMAAYVVDSGMVTADALLMTGILLSGYGMLMILHQIGNEDTKLLARWLCGLLAVIELTMNFYTTGISTTSRTSYTKNWESVKGLLDQVDAMDEELFYRVEELERLTKNDAAIYGYPSSTIFSSLMNIGVSRFYRKVGMEGGKNFYSYSGATPLMSAMLSVKYLIAGNPYQESPLRTLVAEDGENYIYKNFYTLPLGFMTDFSLEENWNPVSGMPVTNLNRLARMLGADEDLLVPLKGTVDAGDEKTTISVLEDCYVYGTYTDTTVTNITVKNQDRVQRYNKCDHGYILDLGWGKAGDVLEISNTSEVSHFQVQAYQLNMEALEMAYEKLSEQTLAVDEFGDTKIKGHITVETEGNLVISIPKEAGFHIFVDGKETEGSMFMESLIEIPLEKGEHQIILKYKTPGLVLGAVISTGSLLAFLFICIWKKGRKDYEIKRVCKEL